MEATTIIVKAVLAILLGIATLGDIWFIILGAIYGSVSHKMDMDIDGTGDAFKTIPWFLIGGGLCAGAFIVWGWWNLINW